MEAAIEPSLFLSEPIFDKYTQGNRESQSAENSMALIDGGASQVFDKSCQVVYI